MVMVGLVSDIRSWAEFSDEWQECLDMRPRLKAFHMAEIIAESWSDDTKARVARFRKIITKHVKGSVIISIPLDNYRRIFAAEGPWRNPYLFLFFVLIRNYKNNCKKVGLSPETEFIFDTQTGAMSRIKEAWEYFANHVPRMLDFIGKPPSFQDDEKVLPLQAADMVAWWVRRQIADDIAGFPRLPFPWDGEDQIPCVRARYDAASLQNAFDEMQGRQGLNTKMLFHLGLWP